MDEFDSHKRRPNKCGWRTLLQATASLRPRKQRKLDASIVQRGAAVLSFPQIKYLRVPDEVIEKVKDTQLKDQAQRGGRGGGQTGRGDRGRGGARGARGGRGRGRGAA